MKDTDEEWREGEEEGIGGGGRGREENERGRKGEERTLGVHYRRKITQMDFSLY